MTEPTMPSPAKSDRNAQIVHAYHVDKKPLRTIALEHEISHERVRQIVARAGVLRHNRFLRRKDVDEKALRRLAGRGLTLGEIADELNMAETNVRVRLASAGITLNPRQRRKKAA